MRPVVLAALAFVVSGCAAAPEAPAAPIKEDHWVTLDPVVLVEGSFRWHETGTSTTNVLAFYNLASQAVAHPCIWEGSGGGEEVYFNNLRLPTGRSSQGLGPWSGNLSVTFDWTDEDWIGTALRAAYQAPGLDGLRETQPIDRGATLTVPIRVPASDEADDEAGGAGGWAVWVCLPEYGAEPEAPFAGSVQAKVVFAPDPVLASMLVEDADPEGRTARTGSQAATQRAP